MEEIIIRKINGESRRTNYKKEIVQKYKKMPHLCMTCDNGCPNKCKKVADERKRNINYYEFITDGFQVVRYGINEEGEKQFVVDRFVVEKCDNYVKEKEKKHAFKTESRENMKKRASLIMHYYGTETVEEAYKIMIQDAVRNINYQKNKNIASGKPETEDLGQYIPSGMKKEFEQEFGIVSTSKNSRRK